jgi:CubicO group peptidase (beta-lactamase class C family)
VTFDSFPRLLRVLEEGRSAGHHPGAQAFVRLGGEVRLDAGFGEAIAGTPMTPDTLMTWLSASKPIAALGILRLLERGRLSLDQPVEELVPGFGRGGKGAMTLLHLLTHTCGFRTADAMWNRLTDAEHLERACSAPLEPGWVPGETAGYQLSASWFVLGEIIRRETGLPFAEWARREIFLPLGMDACHFAAAPEEYRAYAEAGRIGWLHNTSEGRRDPHRFWDTEEGYGRCWPGASGHGPVRELARIYEMLAGGGSRDGVKIVEPATAASMTRRWREGKFDLTFQHKVDWGLGIIVDSNRYGAGTVPYGFGPHSSERTFGHSGAQSSCAFHDPEHGLTAAWVVNGMAGEPVHRRRARALNAALYEDLGLAPAPEPEASA